MNRDDVIKLARNCGINFHQAGWPELERFAALVAAAEREACAKVCDELHWPWHMGDNSGPKECAAAIRARSQR